MKHSPLKPFKNHLKFLQFVGFPLKILDDYGSEVGCKGWFALAIIVVNYVACVLGLLAVQGEDSLG